MNIQQKIWKIFNSSSEENPKERFKQFYHKHYNEYFGEWFDSDLISENSSYVEYLYEIIKEEKKQEKFLCIIVHHFQEKDGLSFYDYEYIIQYVFRFSEGINWEKIRELGIEEAYINIVSLALRYSGYNSEFGYAWKGMERVEQYTKYLDSEVLKKILDSLVYFHDGIIYWNMNESKILKIIQSANKKILLDEKEKLEFYYVYRVRIHNIIVHFMIGWLSKTCSEYRFGSIEEEDKETCVKMENEDNEKWLKCIVENERIIYKNNENEKDILVSYQNELITIKIGRSSTNLEKNVEMPDETRKNIKKFLTQQFDIDSKVEYVVEILFIFLEAAHGIDYKEELKFTNRYSFEWEDKSKEKLLIRHEKEKVVDENFFALDGKKSVIRNINAIIGKNGSGKTTVADMLCYSNLFGEVDKNSYNYLVVFKLGDKIYWKSTLEKEIQLEFEGERIPSSNNYGEGLMDTSVIRYSNIFDIQKFKEYDDYNLKSKNVIDISTQKLVYQDRLFRNSDIMSIMNLFLDMQKETREEFRIPDIDYVKIIFRKEQEQEIRERFYNIYEVNYDYDEEDENEDVTYNSSSKTLNKMLNWIENLQLNFGELCIKAMIDSNVDEDNEILWDVPENFEYFKKFYSESQGFFGDGLITDFNISLEDTEKIEFLYNFSQTINSNYSLFDLHTQYKSSGEMARILLFSRLHAVFHTNEKLSRPNEYGDRRNFILYLDEIEAYFHPKWQQTVIYDLINFLQWEKDTYDSFENIHVIITSNSPFYLSDLPYSNLIFLNDNSKKRDKLFGINIHTILKDIFMMKDCLMGKFAQAKLSEVFKILNKKEQLSDEDVNKIEYMIEILGDNILKTALVELYTQKNSRKQKEFLEEKIRKLQEELEQIKEKENVQDT